MIEANQCVLLSVGELDARTTKDVQGTSNRQVHLAVAELLDQLEILNRAAAAGVCDGNGTPLGQLGHELVVDAALQALYVGGGRSIEDLELVKKLSNGKVDLTIGSALDIFGGSSVKFTDCVEWNSKQV
jgi:phosphoribosylformimino-5-aminoimidazole carboxamide ribonucleotide (ProFAR) isomerase